MFASSAVSLYTSPIMSNRLSSSLESLGTLVRSDCTFQEEPGIQSHDYDCIYCMRNNQQMLNLNSSNIMQGSIQVRQLSSEAEIKG